MLLAKVFVPLAVGCMIVGSAAGQMLPTWNTQIVLSKKDLALIHSVVTNQVHGEPVGTAAHWTNPISGNSGSVRLMKKLTRNDQRCEKIEYIVTSRRPTVYTETYDLTSCLQRDGTWKLAQS
jgi:surface antigen